MEEETTTSFLGIETVSASADGKFLLFKTLDGSGKPHILTLHSDEASGTVFKILTASVQAEKNKGSIVGQTKLISIYDLGLIESKSNDSDVALSVRFESGTAPIGLRLPKKRLIQVLEDMVQALAPHLLTSPISLKDRPLN